MKIKIIKYACIISLTNFYKIRHSLYQNVKDYQFIGKHYVIL
jgi:hypothetical protein